ncbi:unnamed protein product [Dimorphilus gyrociliatus]|uniref:Uncharacterized protein n=1 Tax=Dimorphilus gyrociliatus TaxID=2664684 RepID=A0A7I8VD95_9ANNE|nr:unnamed protein product [Dimorphilus gyrociliatus]
MQDKMSRNQVRPQSKNKIDMDIDRVSPGLSEKYFHPKKIDKLRKADYLEVLDAVRSAPTTLANKRILK